MSAILLVEDDEQKRLSLHAFLINSSFAASVEVCRSYQSALANLKSKTFDLVVLDMSLPTFDIKSGEDGGKRQPYAGMEILRQIARRSIATKVVIVTQFDTFGEREKLVTRAELHQAILSTYSTFYVGMVYYSIVSGRWKEELAEIMGQVLHI